MPLNLVRSRFVETVEEPLSEEDFEFLLQIGGVYHSFFADRKLIIQLKGIDALLIQPDPWDDYSKLPLPSQVIQKILSRNKVSDVQQLIPLVAERHSYQYILGQLTNPMEPNSFIQELSSGERVTAGFSTALAYLVREERKEGAAPVGIKRGFYREGGVNLPRNTLVFDNKHRILERSLSEGDGATTYEVTLARRRARSGNLWGYEGLQIIYRAKSLDYFTPSTKQAENEPLRKTGISDKRILIRCSE